MRLHIVIVAGAFVLTLAACGTAGSGTIPASPVATGPATAPSASAAAPGSFPAFCALIHVRLLAPPRVMQDPSSCRADSLFLTTNITDTTGVEYITVFRYPGDARGQTAAGWSQILESYRTIDAQSGDTAWAAVSQPTPQAAPGVTGYSGTFTRTDKGGMRYAGVLWAGAVGPDTVVVLGQASADRQATLAQDMAQVLGTIDLNAQ